MRNKAFLLSIICLFGCNGNQTMLKTGLEGKPLPSFEVLLLDGLTRLKTNNIASGNNIVFFYFNPNCRHCKAETTEIISEIEAFKNVRFYLLGNSSINLLKKFSDSFQLNKFPNITIAQDCNYDFSKYFNVPGVPYIAIYNKNKRLKQVLIGKVNTNMIKHFALQ